ncbi:MAG: hypothetical protein WBA61_02025 [Aequorivita sp.]
MKNIITLAILSLCMIPLATAQNDCNMYYPLNEGATFQLTSYDKKNKPTAVLDYKVLKIANSAAGKVGTIYGTVKDEKGKMLGELEYDVICKDNKLSVDYQSMLSPQMMEQFKEMDYEISGTNLDWPNDLSVGMILPDGNMTMKIGMGGMNMTMTVDQKNRKVIGKEKMTTPAGTFDCYVITYNTDVKMGINQTTSSKQWVSEGVGMVKQEDSQKGKITNTTMLTAISK